MSTKANDDWIEFILWGVDLLGRTVHTATTRAEIIEGAQRHKNPALTAAIQAGLDGLTEPGDTAILIGVTGTVPGSFATMRLISSGIPPGEN